MRQAPDQIALPLDWPQAAEEDRFLRLLEILGLWYEKGKLLIFVSSQEKCDDLFRNLLRVRLSPVWQKTLAL